MYPFKKFTLGELKGISRNIHKPQGEPILYRLITRPLCGAIQKRLPAAVTPNTITWIGFLVVLTGATLAMVFDWTLTNPPRFLNLLFSLVCFIYLITDSLDGIHARASKQTSPFGKILDHLMDSCSSFWLTIMLASSLRIGYSAIFNCLVLTLLSGFYVAGLVEKYTGSMVFSIVSGASEGLYGTGLIHLFSFLYPNLIVDYLKSPVLNSRITLIFVTYSAIYLTFIFADMVYRVRKVKPAVNGMQLILSVGRFAVLLALSVPFFAAKRPTRLMSTSYLVIISQSFSLSYLEEYISAMVMQGARNMGFLIQYAILILKYLNLLYWASAKVEYALVGASTLHLVLRVGSTLYDLSRQLKVKIFSKTL